MAEMMSRYQHRSLEKRRETLSTLVTPRNVDQVGTLLSLLIGSKMDMAVYDEITKAIKKRIEELGGAQLHKDDSNEPTGIGEADFRKAPRDENK